MSDSMRKIIFYENILEFKENRKDKLTLNEVNNWEICRTCLIDTDVDDVDVEKMCVMDAIQGKFFNIKEMLKAITDMKVSTEDNIASKVCKTCFNKITNLYYFTLQVRKAEQILKHMAQKVKHDNSSTVIKNESKETVEGNEFQVQNTDQSVIIEVEELFGYTPDMENAMEIEANIIEETENVNSIEKEEEMLNFDEINETTDDVLQKIYDDIESELINDDPCQNDEYIEEQQQSESEFNLECTTINEDNDGTFSRADSFEELYITDAEYLQQDLSQSNDNCSSLETNEKPTKHKSKQGTRSLDRMEMPLLEVPKCHACKQTFERQSELVNHVQDEHPNTKAFKCRFCSSAFAHIQSLSRHVRKHKSYVGKYTCQFCYREFLRADDLKRHVRTHTGERPYPCSYCEKSFKQQGEMKSHEATHFPKKTFYCTQCPKTFGSRNGLYLHNRTHHNKFHVGRKKSVEIDDQQNEIEKVLQFSSEEGE